MNHTANGGALRARGATRSWKLRIASMPPFAPWIPTMSFLFSAPLSGIEIYGAPQEHGWGNVGFTEHYYPGMFGMGDPTPETHAKFIAGICRRGRITLSSCRLPSWSGIQM
jgi:hypothetical protein